MALDSKQKRGSTVHCKLPFRRWLSQPASPAFDYNEFISLLKLSAGPPAPTPVSGRIMSSLAAAGGLAGRGGIAGDGGGLAGS